MVKRLIACRNRLYRETGTYPDDLGAALARGGWGESLFEQQLLSNELLHQPGGSLTPSTSRR
jgi:hypothetical protein